MSSFIIIETKEIAPYIVKHRIQEPSIFKNLQAEIASFIMTETRTIAPDTVETST